MTCNISNNTTPGTPKNPTIIAFKGLITMDTPNIPPTRLNRKRITPPIRPFINSLIKILMGITNIIPII